MIRHGVTPLSQIDRRAPEAGRIRLGIKGTKGAPRSIDTFRFTSPNRAGLDALAAKYGGEVIPWSDPKANPSQQFQLTSATNEIRVMLTPDGLDQSYELWAGSGCARRCDGETCQQPVRSGDDYEMVSVPCICDANDALECKPYTRLQVVIPDIPFAGVWRLETKGYNAMAELPGMYELIQTIAARGGLVDALLRLERRERVTPTGKRNFVVPSLAIAQSVDELMIGTANPAVAALSAPPMPALPPSLSDDDRDDEPVEAELIDDELLALEELLRADARNFGLDENIYVSAVKAQVDYDRSRIQSCIDRVRTGALEPTGFHQGRIVWRQTTPKETS